MVATTTLLAHLTAVLAVLLFSLDSTAANNECRRKFMAIAAQQCSLGRARRALDEALLKNIRNSGPPPPYPMAFAPVPRVYPGSSQYYVAALGPAPSIFQPESRFSKGLLPPESGGDVGFDLTPAEMDHLQVAISNRISRNTSGKSLAEVNRLIIQAAAQCCQNIELCSSKDQPYIHCA